MNIKAKKFNIAVGVLAFACILLAAIAIAVAFIVLAKNGNSENNGNDAGTALSLVIFTVFLIVPAMIITGALSLVILAMGITMLATMRGGKTARKAICVTAAVMEIILAVVLIIINIAMALVVPVFTVNIVLALLILGIGIVTCVFAAKYAAKKEV